MGAIISLGNRNESRAALPLARCALGHPTDVVEGLQIVDSLCQLTESVERTQALQMLASSHPGHVVRKAAKKKLDLINQAPIELCQQC